MNGNLIVYVYLFFIGTSILNFAIAVVARVKTKSSEFNDLIYYWPSVILTFVMTGIFRENPVEFAFAYYFQIISSNLWVKIFRDALGLKTNWKFFIGIQLLSMLLSTYLLLESGLGFTYSLLPVCLAFSLPILEPIWFTLVKNRYQTSWIEKFMAWVLASGIIHHFNFAIFRLVKDTEPFGFAITIAQYQCVSILLPLLINHRRALAEKKNLQSALERISGRPNSESAVQDLYKQLEVEISQKDHFYQELQNSNVHLNEERVMNEMLIRAISHDLANPLSVIGTYTELLHQGSVPNEEREKVWKRIKTNTQSALDMIGRIRNAILTRSQASIVKVQNVSLDRSLKKVIEMFETRYLEKDIKVIYQNNSQDIEVLAEENTLTEHVFANIISNAIKFSPYSSEIHITVRDLSDVVEVTVRDFGIGIKKSSFQNTLLESTVGTNGETGDGFGLMVMGYFLRQFGATVNIDSSSKGENQGTFVTIVLKKSHSEENLASHID